MNIVRLILKEAGGRVKNAAGAINSDSNMFAGSSGNAPSDKLGSGMSNPIENTNEGTETDTPEVENNTEVENNAEVEEAGDTEGMNFSDGQLKSIKGKLKNLQLDPMKAMNKGGGGIGGNMGAMSKMFSGIMGASGGAEGAGDASDMADTSDMGDMADMADAADAASDERIKNIFGDNEDIIKTFAKINAIQFTYNDKAKEIPGGEEHGIDNDVHLGVKAQELAENPLTESAVKRDPSSGYLMVDTKELTTANSAVISELCKRIEMLENILGVKVV